MADPTALQTAVAAAQAVQLIGMPEGRIVLAEAVVHPATARSPTPPTWASTRPSPMSGRAGQRHPGAPARRALPRIQTAGARVGLQVRPRRPARRGHASSIRRTTSWGATTMSPPATARSVTSPPGWSGCGRSSGASEPTTPTPTSPRRGAAPGDGPNHRDKGAKRPRTCQHQHGGGGGGADAKRTHRTAAGRPHKVRQPRAARPQEGPGDTVGGARRRGARRKGPGGANIPLGGNETGRGGPARAKGGGANRRETGRRPHHHLGSRRRSETAGGPRPPRHAHHPARPRRGGHGAGGNSGGRRHTGRGSRGRTQDRFLGPGGPSGRMDRCLARHGRTIHSISAIHAVLCIWWAAKAGAPVAKRQRLADALHRGGQ